MSDLNKHFAAMGASLEVLGDGDGIPRIDVESDRDGERFTIIYPNAEVRGRRGRGLALQPNEGPVSLEVLDVDRPGRHLLLMMRSGRTKHKFLCGHDERHWFVAAVPEIPGGVTGVKTAKDALQPAPVRERASKLKKRDRGRRKNAAFIRQGEWFFTPADIDVKANLILKSEPLVRGFGSKPHLMAEAYRTGGITVYVHRSKAPSGITQRAYDALPADQRAGYSPMRRDPELYCRGTVRHADHATIHLDGWHLVRVSEESRAPGARSVAFLD